MNDKISSELKLLGLTKQNIKVYLALSKHEEDLTAQEIAQKVRIWPNAVYRTCRNLEEAGFVKRIQAYPLTYRAIKVSTAVPTLAAKKIEKLQKFTNKITSDLLPTQSDPHPTDINLIYGAENIYEEAAKLLNAANKEMLVISIGEPITPDLLLAVKNARKRNVAVKMIVHKCDKENLQILENFKKNGYIIRYFPGWGFHMAIYDSKKTLLIINNPENIQERAAMLINSTGLTTALHDYFYATWKKAKII